MENRLQDSVSNLPSRLEPFRADSRRMLTDAPDESAGPSVPLGVSCLSGRKVALPESALRYGSLVLGLPGYGRHGFLVAVVGELLRRKVRGSVAGPMIVLGPSSGLLTKIWRVVPASIRDEVNLLDFGNPNGESRFNPVDPTSNDIAWELGDVIARSVRPSWGKPEEISEELIRLCLSAICDLNSGVRSAPETKRGFVDVLELLKERASVPTGRLYPGLSDFQALVLSRVTQPAIKERLLALFNCEPSELMVIRDRYEAWLRHAMSRPGAPRVLKSHAADNSLSDAMEQGSILMINTAENELGDQLSGILGSVIVAQVVNLLIERKHPRDHHIPFCTIVCDGFLGYRGADWRSLMVNALAHRCSLFLSESSLHKSGNAGIPLTNALLTQLRTFVGYRTEVEDAEMLAEEMGRDLVKVNHLTSLDQHQCYVHCAGVPAVYRPISVMTR